MLKRVVYCFLFLYLMFPYVVRAQGGVLHNEGDMAAEKNEKALFFPVIFDSIKASDLQPYFVAPTVSFKKNTDLSLKKTRFQEDYEKSLVYEKIQRNSVYRLSKDMPEYIEYYNLQPYNKELDRITVEEREIRISGLEPMSDAPELGDIRKFLKQKENSPWKFFGNLAVQFSQYYVTENWYKGGTPNATLLGLFEYNIDYEKERFLWENDFDVKIGFYNTSEDTIRAFRVNNDEFKISTLAAYQTWFSKKVYYSAAVDFNTCLFTGYKKTNSNEVVSAFLSPTRTFFSLGMECRYNKKTSIRVSPFAYKLLFSVDDRLDPLHIGLDSTEHHVGYLGYLIQAKIDWKFSKEINLTSKISFFSSYNAKNIELDWEVVGKFIINRYLSTRLSLIMRYDNTPKDEIAKIQVQEQLSFGFNYVFR